MASGIFYDSVRMKQIEDTTIVDGDVVSGNLILTQRNGTQINAGNVVGPTGPAAPTYTSGTTPYGVGTRYARVARLDGLSALSGAEVQFDFYGGQNYGDIRKYSAFVQVGQRGTDGIQVNVWEKGLFNSGIVWYTRRISSFVFEIWVKLPDYASPVVVQPRQTMNAFITYDTVQTSAPSNLLQTYVSIFNEDTETVITGLLEATYRAGPAKVKVNGILTAVEYPWLTPYNPTSSREVRMQKIGNNWWIVGQNNDDYRQIDLNDTFWTTYGDATASTNYMHQARAVKLPSGVVILSGLLRSKGSPADGTIIGTLPPGFAPDNDTLLPIEMADLSKAIRIGADGNIYVYGTYPSNQYLALDGLVWLSAGTATWTSVGSGGSSWGSEFGPDSGWVTQFGAPAFWKDPYGFVWFRGLAKILTAQSADNKNVILLPATHRPNLEMHIRAVGNSGFSFWGAKPTDGVNWKGGSVATVGSWISLASIIIPSSDAMANNPWVTPYGMANSWSAYGAQFTQPGYLLREDGLRILSGLFGGGSYGTHSFTFKDYEYIPDRGQMIIASVTGGGRGRFEISGYDASAGTVGRAIMAQGSVWYSLDSKVWIP